MTTNIQRLTSSPLGVNLASTVFRALPLWLGYRLADFFANQIAEQRDTPLVRAVRANQWVVSGECLEKEDLDWAVRKTFRYMARSIFDLYHYIDKPEAVRKQLVINPFIEQSFNRPEFDQQGQIVVGLHMSSFDLVLQWVCKQGIKPLALTIPHLEGGHQIEYQIRKRTGLNLLPASVGTLRQTIRHLQEGGLVVTGIDRPIPDPVVRPTFFGRPAALPTAHAFLALKAGVPIRLMVSQLHPDGKYHVLTSDPIVMDHHPDREVETLRNAEKVLNIAETFIRQAPHQWSISLPVWPETLALVPD